MEIKTDDLKYLEYLMDMKENTPERYKKFLTSIKEITKDLMKISLELSEDLK